SGLIAKLIWVGAISCCPWAALTRGEARIQGDTPFEEFVVFVLLLGCTLVILMAVGTHGPLSWDRLAFAFAAPLLAGAVGLTFNVVRTVRDVEKGELEGRTCLVHVHDENSPENEQQWVVGRDVDSETYSRLKDEQGHLHYVIFRDSRGQRSSVFLSK